MILENYRKWVKTIANADGNHERIAYWSVAEQIETKDGSTVQDLLDGSLANIIQVEELPTENILPFPTLYAVKVDETKYTLQTYENEVWKQYSGSGAAGSSIVKTLSAGATTLSFTSTAITSDSTITVFADKFGIAPTNITFSGNTVTLTFDAMEEDVKVKIVLDTVGEIEPEPDPPTPSKLTVTVNKDTYYGKEVTVTNGVETLIGNFSDTGSVEFELNYVGIYSVTCEDLNNTVTNSELGSTLICELTWVAPPKPTVKAFSECTDEELTTIVDAYYNDELTLDEITSVWRVGDKRTFHLNAMDATGVSESHHADDYDFVILGFNHDKLTTPINGKTNALLSVQTDRVLFTDTTTESYNYSFIASEEQGYMNSTDTNVGGWTECARRTWCNAVFKNSLPTIIQTLMKAVDKKTSAGNQSTTINTTSDYAWLPSEIEIFGSTTYSVGGEGTQYDYFTTEANRYKKPVRKTSSTTYNSAYWWERSPDASNSTLFCCVCYSGTANSYYAGYCRGLAPAFCL